MFVRNTVLAATKNRRNEKTSAEGPASAGGQGLLDVPARDKCHYLRCVLLDAIGIGQFCFLVFKRGAFCLPFQEVREKLFPAHVVSALDMIALNAYARWRKVDGGNLYLPTSTEAWSPSKGRNHHH